MSAPTTSPAERPFLIVGAGVAGLSLAYLLLKAGRRVTLVERNAETGGLARSFQYDGFTFDLGPKRFHTDDPEVTAFIHEILGPHRITISRSSMVYLFDRYFDWPLTPSTLVKLPPTVMIRAGLDLLRKREASGGPSFSEYTKARYGETLYRLFFKPYTEKFLRVPCETVHVDWAKTGINRAVIDRRIKSASLVDLARSMLLPQAVKTEFIYPSYGGFGTFCSRLEAKVRELGGTIHLGTTVTRLGVNGDEIGDVALSSGETLRPGFIVWTGNILSLYQLLGDPPPKIQYLSTLCYNVALTGDVAQQTQWIYYGSAALTMSRVTITKHLGPYMSPPGTTGLCVEVTCFEGDEMWKAPETLVSRLTHELEAVRLARAGRILWVKVEAIRDTYPVYDLDYRVNFASVSRTAKRFRNLRLLGRTGAFWYNNSDHSMKMALNMAQHLVRGAPVADKDELFAG